MKRILVTGANGFIGRALTRRLCDSGFDVRGAVRTTTTSLDCGCKRVVVGDIGSATDWASALDGVDAIVHLAGRVHIVKDQTPDPLASFRRINVEGTCRLALQAAATGVKRLVYLSSIGVLGHKTNSSPFTEHSPVQPRHPYTISKWEAEQVLHKVAMETGLEIVIVRPPLVYGPGNPGNFLKLLRWINRGLPLPLGSVNNQRSFIGIGNLIDFLMVCIAHPRAANEVFLVADAETVSTPDLIRQLAKFLGKRARLFPFPVFLLRFGAKLLGQSETVARLTDSLLVCSEKARQVLGWVAKTPLDQGLEQTAKWYKETYEKHA